MRKRSPGREEDAMHEDFPPDYNTFEDELNRERQFRSSIKNQIGSLGKEKQQLEDFWAKIQNGTSISDIK